MNRAWLGGMVACALASAALAQERRPAPEYYVQTLMATTMASNIGQLCPGLGYDSRAASDRLAEAKAELAEDGHDPENLSATLEDPGAQVQALQNRFLGRYGLQRTGEDFMELCDAGHAEIAAGTEIGSYLFAVNGSGAVDPGAATGD